MAKLDVTAQAAAGLATAEGVSEAVADVSVTLASDGTAVTGLTDDDFDVWVCLSTIGNASFRPGARQMVEKAINGEGPDGVYFIGFNGNEEPGGPWTALAQTVFVEIVVRTGDGDTGQTIAKFRLP